MKAKHTKKQGRYAGVVKEPFGVRVKKDLRRNWLLYVMLIPVLTYYLIFKYGPMFGLSMAFVNYKPAKGILGSTFVGLKHFKSFFQDYYFYRLLRNTAVIACCSLIFTFPMPIILALMINELKLRRYSKVVQTVTYIPHFVSTVVICGMITVLCSSSGGITRLLSPLGVQQTNLLNESRYFLPIYFLSAIWQETGWGSIVYLSALMGIDQELYAAAKVDGAGRWRQMIHVTFPGIVPTIVVMFILKVGKVFDVGYEKILLLYTQRTYEVADVINTYVYRKGVLGAQFSYAAAVGLFNSVVCFGLVYLTNRISRKINGNSLW